MKFADPKNDVAFKKIFGDERHKEVLISFLNAILDFKDEKVIVDVKLDNTYQLSQIEELKDYDKVSLKKGLDIKTVSLITELSTEEIKNIC